MNFTADSHHYQKIAGQIYQNGFISIWKNKQLVYWPPLYPLVLSWFQGPNSLIFIKYFHYLLAISLFIIWHFIAAKYFKNRNHLLLFMILLSLSTHILMITVFIWSELLFLVLFSIVILCVEKYLLTNKLKWLLISVFPSFLMLIERNAGIFLITSFYFALFIFNVYQRKHYKSVIICFIVSISGFLFWNVNRIILESRLYMISELIPYFTPLKNFHLVLNEVGSVFYPSLFFSPLSLILTFGLLSITAFIVFGTKDNSFLKTMLLTSLLYLSVWIIIPGDPSNMGRFISIVVPILLLAFVVVFNEISRKMSFPSYLNYILISIMIIYSTIRITNNALLWGGVKSYINFGEIHENTFYEKSERMIGRPPSE